MEKSTEHKVQRVNKCPSSGGNAKVPPLGGKFYSVCCMSSSLVEGPRILSEGILGDFDVL